MRKILVVNVNWLGDVVFSSAVFENLHEAYPQAKISCLAPTRVQDILQCIPFVDEIICYDENGHHHSFWGKLKLIRDLRQKRFDAVFLLHRSLTRALLVFFAGVPVRVGYNTKGRGIFLTQRIPEPKGVLHRQDYYLRILEVFGIPIKQRRSQLCIDSQSLVQLNRMLADYGIEEKDFLLIIHPGGNWDLKRWPKENFSRLIDQVWQTFQKSHERQQFKIILSGADKDIPLIQEILQLLDCIIKKNVINLTGKVGLKTLMALMKRANLVISADSGPLHIASSVGTKTIAIFGPTSSEITGPRGSGFSKILKVDIGCNRGPCYYLQCPENTCMKAVTVHKVFEGIKEILFS